MPASRSRVARAADASSRAVVARAGQSRHRGECPSPPPARASFWAGMTLPCRGCATNKQLRVSRPAHCHRRERESAYRTYENASGRTRRAQKECPVDTCPVKIPAGARRLLRGDHIETLTCTGVRRRPIGGDRAPSLLWHEAVWSERPRYAVSTCGAPSLLGEIETDVVEGAVDEHPAMSVPYAVALHRDGQPPTLLNKVAIKWSRNRAEWRHKPVACGFAPPTGLEPVTCRLTVGCSAN